MLVDKQLFTPEEGRQQTIADGLTSISLPEKKPESDLVQDQTSTSQERPGLLGRPIAPSDGGHGEVIPRSELFDIMLEEVPEFRQVVEDIEEKWDELDLKTKDAVLEELQECLNVSEVV
jgi:hypothetical protein